jgi:hypothetical protein
MPDFEFRFKTKKGELIVNFNNPEELKEKLDKINEIVKIIDEKTEGMSFETQKEILQGLEDVYTYDADGLIKFLRLPKNISKSNIIRLALFLSPRPLNLKELTKVTGVNNPLAYMGSKHFMKLSDGTYTLKVDGRTYVTSKVIPKLRDKTDKF